MTALVLEVDPAFRNAQFGEAMLWWFIAAVFGFYAVSRDTARRRCALTAAVFLAFGLSDVVEAYTGKWWEPWWLFAWKAACVAGMVVLLIADIRAKRRAKEAGDTAQPNAPGPVGSTGASAGVDAEGDADPDGSRDD